MLSVNQRSIKYHFLSLWYDLTWDWTLVSTPIGEHSATRPKGRRIQIIIIRNTWNNTIVGKLFVFDMNNWYHITVYKKVNTNIQCTRFPNLSAWNESGPVDMPLKPINHLVNLTFFRTKFLWIKPGEIQHALW